MGESRGGVQSGVGFWCGQGGGGGTQGDGRSRGPGAESRSLVRRGAGRDGRRRSGGTSTAPGGPRDGGGRAGVGAATVDLFGDRTASCIVRLGFIVAV